MAEADESNQLPYEILAGYAAQAHLTELEEIAIRTFIDSINAGTTVEELKNYQLELFTAAMLAFTKLNTIYQNILPRGEG